MAYRFTLSFSITKCSQYFALIKCDLLLKFFLLMSYKKL